MAVHDLAASFVHDGAALAAIGWKVLDRVHFGGSFALSPHGVGIAVGYLAGAFVLAHEGPKRGVSERAVNSLVFWGLIGAIVGARVGYVITHASQFHSVGDVFAVYRGGISLIGGIIGWILVAIPILRGYRLSVLNTFDAAAMPLAVGVVICRVGDLIIGDHLGTPTNFFLAFRYDGGNLAGYDCTSVAGTCTIQLSDDRTQVITHDAARLFDANFHQIAHGVGVNQTALYDWLSAMGLTLLLLWLLRSEHRVGVITISFALWYAAVRVLTDFLRVENRFLGLTGSQWASLAVIALCIGLLAWIRRRRVGASGPSPPGPPDATGEEPAVVEEQR
jgi:phosphatidylglycerol:prolipoprotein diacylglycerol transferase